MSNYLEQTAQLDLNLIRGQEETFIFSSWEKDGVPFILEGKRVRMDVKKQVDICRYPELSLRAGSGLIVEGNNLTVVISPEMSACLCGGDKYFYDIVVEDIVYIRGSINLTGRVTR